MFGDIILLSLTFLAGFWEGRRTREITELTFTT